MEPVDAAAARSNAVRRLTFLVCLLLLWSIAILARLVSIQVVHHQKYIATARKQQELKIEQPAVRGPIYDRNKHPLALSVTVDSVSVNPLNVPDLSVASEVLSENLGLDRDDLYARMQWAARTKHGYLVVKHKITPVESERLKSLPVNWIDFKSETQRYYPNGQIAAHVIGGVYQQEKGVAGIEKGLDEVLRGKPGTERVLTDVKRRGIEHHVEQAPEAGEPIYLTIDYRIQYVAERELAAAIQKHHCRSGSVVVMNPYNGEILAFANFPTYDPNIAPKKGDDKLARFNLGDQVPFEPGSVFKVITLSAALETTDLKPETLVHTGNGALVLPGRIVHDTKAHGTITFQQVLEQSSNIGAILIGKQVGREKMYEYMRRFGFGAPAGLPLPAESGGKLRKLNHWGTTSLASVSMGQEVSTTSVQLARAAAVIANGGLLVKPKLVLKRGDQMEPTEAPVRILNPKTAITMRTLMEGVVLRGTGRNYCRLDGYSSAGKTGSAQIFDTNTGHYTHTYNASFMGFAPVTNPALIVMVTLNGTVGEAGFGGPSAGPVYKVVMTEALRILDVPKDLPETDQPAKEEQTLVAQSANDLPIVLDGGHSILEEDPTANTSGDAPGLDELAKADAGPVVPEFRGKTMREVVEESAESGVVVALDGSGIAWNQTPAPGTALMAGTKVRVQFRR